MNSPTGRDLTLLPDTTLHPFRRAGRRDHHMMPTVGIRSRLSARRRRDDLRLAATYRALSVRIWLLRTAGFVAVSAAVGAVFLPLLGSSGPGESAWFGGVFQLGLQVYLRLVGRMAARKEAGL
jgi:hypothetical protein